MAPSQSTLASNNFCVSRHVADLVEELESKRSSRKAKGNTWSDEEAREFQALCESRSVLTSMQIWNQTHGKKMSERSAYALKDHAPTANLQNPCAQITFLTRYLLTINLPNYFVRIIFCLFLVFQEIQFRF